MKGRRRVGDILSAVFAFALCGACAASAQTLSITNTTHVPAAPRAGQDVFIETQTSPTGAAVEAYTLFGVEENWSGVALEKTPGATNEFDQWRGRIGRFPADTAVEYLAGAEDAAGTNWYDLDGTNHFVFSVTNGDATTWIGDIYHSPTNGALTSDTNLTLNLFAFPSQTLVNAFADYSVNGWIWERVPLDYWQMDGSNEWWRAEIGLLPPGSTVWYAFDAEDGTGAIHIRPTNGVPYSALVAGSSTDNDSDGLPDDWEQFWFNGLTNTAAGGNPDADGQSDLLLDNWMERVMGTDPADSNVVEDLQVLWRPSSPVQGGAIKLSLNEDPLEPLYARVISALINQGPGLTNQNMELRADLNGRFTNLFLLATNASYCKIIQLASENGTNDNRGVGWTIPAATASGSVDTDGDGMPDAWEIANKLDPFADDASDDEDGDELTNAEEYALGTDPWLVDTDGDGWSDGEEVVQSTDPLDRMDAPAIARGVVINEVLYDATGDDTGKEFVELYSSSPFDVDLSGFRLQGTLSSNPSNFLNIFTFPTGAVIQSGRALLVGGNLMAVQPDYITNFALVNRSSGNQKTAGVRLITPSAMTPTTTVDALLYNYPNTFNLPTNGYGAVSATNIYATTSNSLARRLNGLDTDHVSDWIRTNHPSPTSSTTVYDSDGDGWNDAEEIQAGTSPWDRLAAPRIARGVVVNEAVYNPEDVDLGREWVELYCAGPNPVDLSGFYLDGTLSSASSNLTRIFTFPTNATILPGSHVLVGGNAMSIRRDYTQNFELVNNSRGYRTGGVRLMAATNLVVDALLYDYPNIYNLPTNGFGYIGYPGDLPTFAISGESVVRARKGVDTDNVDDWIASANPSPEHAESVVDTDGDGITDGDELSGQSNLGGQATDYLLADTDGDGLDDGEEFQIGTDPWSVDTDGDGIYDGMEAHEVGSNPLVDDIGVIAHTVWSANGSDYTNSLGVWAEEGTSACSLSAGGSLYYEMSLPTGGVFALEVEGTQYDPTAANSAFVLQLSVDDDVVSSKELRTEYGEVNGIHWMLPYLDVGTHSVRIRWIFMAGNGSLRLIGIKAHEYWGQDNNMNGQADWLDYRTNTAAGIVNWKTNSYISPFCMEGTALNYDSLSVEGSHVPSNGIHSVAVAKRGLIGCWYADIPLAPRTATVVAVNADHGWLTFQNTLDWEELNLFVPPTNNYLVRLNDGFLFNARPDGEGDGDVKLTVDGVQVYESVSNEAWECYFTNAGIYEVSGTWSQGGTTEYAQTVTVEVVGASFGGDPGVWVGKEREWACVGIPSNVWVEMDRDVLWSQTVLPTGTLFTLRLGQPKAYTAIGRLGGGDGPIISTARIRGFTEVFSSEYGQQAYAYDDGSSRVVMGLLIVAEEMPAGMEITIDIIAGGVVFSDYYVDDFLTTSLTLTTDDLNEWGVAPLAFYVAPDAWGTYCHVLMIEQDGNAIGEW